MRTETRSIYKFDELSEQSQAIAIEEWRSTRDEIFFMDELITSLKELFKTANITILEYCLSQHDNYLKLDILQPVANLKSARAMAWLENNLFNKLRITRLEYLANRKNYFSYGYQVGMIKPCPFTGCYADDKYLESILQSIKQGDSLGTALTDLGCSCRELIELEDIDQSSAEYIRDHLIINDYEYTENGKKF